MHVYINEFEYTDKCVDLKWSLSSRELEKVSVKLVNISSSDLSNIVPGKGVIIESDEKLFDDAIFENYDSIFRYVMLFEGTIYERRIKHENTVECDVEAYCNLILYDRHVVYRVYQTGTTAGEIIRDLASLEPGADVSNVDDGSQLLSPWEIENAPALEVMKSVAKGTNYWLRMKPNKVLVFKPKQTGAYKAIIDSTKIISAEYDEDRWKLKNRVIYVGADDKILADVSEGTGDLPVVVHDPFLTDPVEAERRARIRLALNKEYGRQLRIEMHQADFEALNVDLGDTIRVNLPSLGLTDQDLYLVEVEYDPRAMRYTLTLGGRLELFEEFFEEAIGGDVAARFGQAVKVPELISNVYTTVDALNITLKIQADARTVRLYNKPPLLFENAQNIILDENGYARLIAGATAGSFEFSCLPKSELFTRWLRVHYYVEENDGSVKVDLLRADGSIIKSDIPQDYDFPYLPEAAGWWTEQNASEWGIQNGSLEDSENAIISYWSIKAIQTSSPMKIYYPRTKNADWDLSRFKYIVLYLYSENDDPDLKVRLKQDESNYFEATLNHIGGAWKKYQISFSSVTRIGSPNLSQINYLEIETDLMSLCIDSDYVFIPAAREQLKLKFTLTRPTPNSKSPRVKLAKFIWREGR